MANSQSMCTSFKVELLNALHQFGSPTIVSRTSLTAPTADTIKALLVLASASVSATQTNVGTPGTGSPTTSNVGTNEVSGSGYTAGGVAVTMGTAPTSSGTTAFITPSASIVYSSVTLSTSFDAVVLYNNTQTNRAISVHTFTAQTITAGTLTLTMPTNDASNALIRLA